MLRRAGRRRFLGALAVVAAVAAALWQTGSVEAAPAQSEGMKTLAVVSVSGYDEIKKDARFIGSLAGMPGLDQMMEMQLDRITQGQGLAGLDKTKPCGAVVQVDGSGQPEVLGFIGVTDLKKLLGVLTMLGVQSEETGDGIFEIDTQTQQLYVKQIGEWAFLGRTSESLAHAPSDPLKLLEGLNKKYDVAARLFVQNVPEMYRAMALEQLKQGIAEGLEQMPEEDDGQYALRKKYADTALKNLANLINDTDHLTFGLSLDSVEERTLVDMSMVAMPGSDLAKQLVESAGAKSQFGGFAMADAAISMNIASKVAEHDISQVLALLSSSREQAMKKIDEEADLPDDEARKLVKSAVGDLMDVLSATLKEGVIDGAAAVKMELDAITFIAGVRLADPKRVETALKKLAELAKDEEDFPGVDWNAEEHDGVTFHTIRVLVPEDDARKFFGDEAEIVVGVGKKSLYWAFGKDGISTLKAAIDGSGSSAGKAAPVAVSLSLGKIMKFVAATNPDPKAAMFAQLLDQAGEKDHVTLKGQGIENGFTYRLEIEAGALKAIGQAYMMQAMGGGLR